MLRKPALEVICGKSGYMDPAELFRIKRHPALQLDFNGQKTEGLGPSSHEAQAAVHFHATRCETRCSPFDPHFTTIVPVICGWIEQKYLYVPGFRNVCEKCSPESSGADLNSRGVASLTIV
ncbi:hypothetical protein AWB69_01767 [Caballeronia udeis]|uniref:Uncharacterized protein n=1 Tax=Caballeronia udeis TaxID=1232866 RepID=A0A158FXF3_9BURK|nr:hypothetical protein AWB69_01767 [Caballeronia udeis]